MPASQRLPTAPPASRHEAVLDAAVAVFARYGFRKASMDEVARAAGVSRQGLYLQFAHKEELFRKAVAHQLDQQLGAAISALARKDRGLEANLVVACVEWSGKHAGMLGADAADLMCASTSVAGATLAHYQTQFEKALEQAIAVSPLAIFCADVGIAPADVARALHATVHGLKHSSKSRDDFADAMTAAVRMFCMPLNQRP